MSSTVFRKLITDGKSLMGRIEKQVREGYHALAEDDRVLTGEIAAWLTAASAAVDHVFGADSPQGKAYRQSMSEESHRMWDCVDKGIRSPHGCWSVDAIGHAIGLLAEYQYAPEALAYETGDLIVIGGHVGDIYNTGQAGAVGPHAQARDIAFQQVWNQKGVDIDLRELARELEKLRLSMRTNPPSPENDEALGHVASAQTAAASGNGPKTLEHLKSAGTWAFGVAQDIGTSLAVKAIAVALGLPDK